MAAARFQFTTRSMLYATTFVALALGTLTWLDIPFSSPVVQGFLGGYLTFVGLWAILRGPAVFASFSDLSKRRRTLAAKRSALEREIAERRAAHKKEATDPVSCDPPAYRAK
jgi:hypothetical protein